MRFVFALFLGFLSLASCTNISFLLDENTEVDFLKNKTAVYLSGWDNPVLKEIFFIKLGETPENRFLLTAEVVQKQTKGRLMKIRLQKKLIIKF